MKSDIMKSDIMKSDIMKSENQSESKSCFKKDYSEFFKDIEVNRERDIEINHSSDCDDFSPEFQARIPEDNRMSDCEED